MQTAERISLPTQARSSSGVAARWLPPNALRARSRGLRGATLALAALVAAGAGGSTEARAEIAVEGARVAFEPPAVRDLVAELETWLDAHTDLPRADLPPEAIVLVDTEAEATQGQSAHVDDTVRATYDEEEARIYLVRPWYSDRVQDRSVLLHELVHHRQAAAQHWYCPQAMEWDAYLIQESYLEQRGETGDFNWAWVAMLSSCSTGEHHPE